MSQALINAKTPDEVYQNILLNAFRIFINGSLAVDGLVDGFIDEFEDETGVDNSATLNESYDSSNDLYEGTTSEINEIAIDGSTSLGLGIKGATGVNQRIAQSFTLDNARTIEKLYIKLVKTGSPVDNTLLRIETDNSGDPSGTLAHANATKTIASSGVTTEAFHEFAFASNFALSASTLYWIVLSRSGARDASNYIDAKGETGQPYAGGNVAEDMSGTWGHRANDDINFKIVYNQKDNLTLIADDQTADANANSGRIIILVDDVEAMTINTDLTAEISNDSGVTWDLVTLALVSTLSNGDKIVYGDKAFTAPDTAITYRVKTLNNKHIEIKSVGMLWE